MDIEEAQGFKSEIGKKKAINKQRKQDAKSQKQRRQDKIEIQLPVPAPGAV